MRACVVFFFSLSLFLPTCNDRNPLECLGQGGRDPLSETLEKGLFAEDNFYSDEVEHAFWNDELQATADAYDADVCAFSAYSDEAFPYTPCEEDADCGLRCSGTPYGSCGGDNDCAAGQTCKAISCASRQLPHYNNVCGSPWGHSKGALAFEKDATGFLLQATTPNWPDPSQGSSYAPLGCQLDDNTVFSQSFMGLTMGAEDFKDLAPVLNASRLCSTGSLSCRNGSAGHMMYGYNCTSEQTRGAAWSILDEAFSGASTTGLHSVYLDVPLGGGSSSSSSSSGGGGGGAAEKEKSKKKEVATARRTPRLATPGAVRDRATTESDSSSSGSVVTVLSHAQEDAVPPWLLVAALLGVDLGVANWWEYNYGQASICSGDDYSLATNHMCLTSTTLGLTLGEDGGAAQSVENAIAASFSINGTDLAWGLWGDLSGKINSHAKYGVAAVPTQNSSGIAGNTWVVSGDENNQGFSCSKECSSSQNGRGGLFFALKEPELHASLYDALKMVCACNRYSKTDSVSRFCYFGCYWKQKDDWMKKEPTYNQLSSFWDVNQKAWIP